MSKYDWRVGRRRLPTTLEKHSPYSITHFISCPLLCFCSDLFVIDWRELYTLWQKEKLFNMSIFSFCHNAFKSRLPHLRQNGSSTDGLIKSLSGKAASCFDRLLRWVLVWESQEAQNYVNSSAWCNQNCWKRHCLTTIHSEMKDFNHVLQANIFWRFRRGKHLSKITAWRSQQLLFMNNVFFCHSIFNFI